MIAAAGKTHIAAALHGSFGIEHIVQLLLVGEKLVVPEFGLRCIYSLAGLQYMLTQVIQSCLAFYALGRTVVHFVVEVIISHHLAVGRTYLQGHTETAEAAAKSQGNG